MNHNLKLLEPYPFEKLRNLLNGVTTADLTPINLSIGEPKHLTPSFILQALQDNITTVSQYPLTKGSLKLRTSIKNWLQTRFKLSNIDAETQILPVNGTREALFALAQTVLNPDDLVIMPNPFYQIYQGAGLLAGAKIKFLNLFANNNFQPDFTTVSTAEWQQCKLIYICSPHNPTGSVLNRQSLTELICLAQKYDFLIAADECYSEIYFDEQQPPLGLLQVATEVGLTDFNNCLVLHSLSKRSNVPGLRSGFAAGDAKILAKFLLYRTYHGSAMPPPTQVASVIAWQDEQHVISNRELYQHKFAAVINNLQMPVNYPDAGFYLWLKTPISDTDFALGLYQTQNVTVIPGSFLARTTDDGNPGEFYVRVALVTTIEECIIAASRINYYYQTL